MNDGREQPPSPGAGTGGAHLVARYREWIGLRPAPGTQVSAARGQQTTVEDLDPSRPVELAVLALKEGAARTRRLGSDQCLTLRTSGLWRVVPGDIATVHARRQWRYAGHPYMSGDITDVRLNRHGLAASSGWMSAKAQRSHALHLE